VPDLPPRTAGINRAHGGWSANDRNGAAATTRSPDDLNRLSRKAAIGLALAALAVVPQAAFAYQDLRSPDARDAAAGRGSFNSPEETVVKLAQPSPSSDGGLDWGDAGIGAGALLGLLLLGLGGTLAVMHRRHSVRRQAATTG
jgi:hypothetical protein